MSGLYENDEISLPLVTTKATGSHDLWRDDRNDRMHPGPSGGIMGLFAGALALFTVHWMAPAALVGPMREAAAQWGVTPEISFGVAYATAAAIGALVGACFASVTRYLRRWFPLVLWALVFFVSLTLLLLALSRTYGRGIGVEFAPAILASSAAYAFLVSFALPLRRRAR
jgi:hypothetical protein